MASYNFLKQAKAYVVTSDNKQYRVDIASVSFSQTFTESSYKVKTLHSQDMFEGSVINKANPANFELNVPALQEDDNRVLFDRLLDTDTFDLYIATEGNTFKLKTCIITNGKFVIEQFRPLSFMITGQASELSAVASIPGVVQGRSLETNFNAVSAVRVILGSADVSQHISSLSLELQNEVKWNPYTTIQGAIGSNTMFPTEFTIVKKILSGNIQRFLTDETDTDFQNYTEATSLNIKAGSITGSTLQEGFEFNIPSCSFTTRVEVQSAFLHNYDWRMTDNSSLTNIITYITN